MSAAAATPRAATAGRIVGEVAGGFGDIGLLAPLAVALITLNHLNATVVLAGAGLFYIATALTYRLPVPVQPLKAVSAIAIASGLGASAIGAAGLMIGAVFVLLSVTGLATWLQRVFVKPVVRGIQLGIGLLLALAAVGMLARPAQLTVADGPLVSVGVVLAVAIGLTVAFCLLAFNRAGLPGGALLLLGAGAALGLAVGVHPVVDVALGPAPLILRLPSAFDFASAFWLLVVPQVGLSIGNSLVATAATARRYFGEAARGVTTRRLALTMGLANLAVSPLGGMPMCHGAGGMTAHVKTGARTGLGTGVFGAVLVVLGVALGGTAPAVVGVLPPAVLGGFLLYVGLQHVTLAADLRGWMEISVAAVVAVIAVVTGNISLGVVAGLGVCWLVSLWRSRRAAPPAPPAR